MLTIKDANGKPVAGVQDDLVTTVKALVWVAIVVMAGCLLYGWWVK